ncbi:unnamed protein product [Caenorhabditis angaria]|uniref:Uncharacterized protein n=1 Tax=Caenorhabditis angaria TaxID=860376 RepID=A0A9P1J160_9PELO|nr:unnamed protein product [Caenorhabditis angaria]
MVRVDRDLKRCYFYRNKIVGDVHKPQTSTYSQKIQENSDNEQKIDIIPYNPHFRRQRSRRESRHKSRRISWSREADRVRTISPRSEPDQEFPRSFVERPRSFSENQIFEKPPLQPKKKIVKKKKKKKPTIEPIEQYDDPRIFYPRKTSQEPVKPRSTSRSRSRSKPKPKTKPKNENLIRQQRDKRYAAQKLEQKKRTPSKNLRKSKSESNLRSGQKPPVKDSLMKKSEAKHKKKPHQNPPRWRDIGDRNRREKNVNKLSHSAYNITCLMGCDLSTPRFNNTSAFGKVHPVESINPTPIKPVEIKSIKSAPTLNRQSSLQPSTENHKRPLTRSSSIGSMLENRPPSGISNASYSRVYRSKNILNRRYTIDTSRSKSNQPVVSLCAKKIGIIEYPDGNPERKPCDVYWHNVVYNDLNKLITSPNSKVNKFPGMTELAKKISLTHAISSMQKLFPDEYAFYPKSWFLPAHLNDFHAYFHGRNRKENREREEMWFIVKPDEGAQGTGIYLINNPDQIRDPAQKQLVQEYVADPLLMSDQLKFDFRVYGVIKSINPLSIYVAREGMARFCTEKYEKPDSSNFKNLYAHLTNYSLNKANDSYVHSHSLKDQIRGSKRLLSTVFHQLESRGVKTKKLWHDIKLILVKTTLAMLPEIMLHYEHHFYDNAGPQCFQIMGFDILICEDGRPILLEVNSAPSLTADHIVPFPGKSLADGGQRVRSVVDEVIKVPLVRDTLLLVLGLLDEEYAQTTEETKSLDDFQTIKQKRKPHLSEIFPTRYGAHSGHLLFLDKAMYIYMQFVQLRNNVNITNAGLKQFVRKCNLTDVLPINEVDPKIEEINYYFTGDRHTSFNGLPFHAFLMFLFFVADRKFYLETDTMSKVQRLLSFCDMSLRHYGVRSARLRRAEVDSIKDGVGNVEIYMLPGRMQNRQKIVRKKPLFMDANANHLPKIIEKSAR